MRPTLGRGRWGGLLSRHALLVWLSSACAWKRSEELKVSLGNQTPIKDVVEAANFDFIVVYDACERGICSRRLQSKGASADHRHESAVRNLVLMFPMMDGSTQPPRSPMRG